MLTAYCNVEAYNIAFGQPNFTMRLATLVLVAPLLAVSAAAPVPVPATESPLARAGVSPTPSPTTHSHSTTTHTSSTTHPPTSTFAINKPSGIPPPPGQKNLDAVSCLSNYEQYLPPIVGAGIFALFGLVGLTTM